MEAVYRREALPAEAKAPECDGAFNWRKKMASRGTPWIEVSAGARTVRKVRADRDYRQMHRAATAIRLPR